MTSAIDGVTIFLNNRLLLNRDNCILSSKDKLNLLLLFKYKYSLY